LKRAFKVMAIFFAALWALFILLVENNPKDVAKNSGNWLEVMLSIPLVKKLAEFASSPLVYAFTFLLVGFTLGWFAKRYSNERENDPWWKTLGYEMSSLAYDIRSYGGSETMLVRLNAEIDVVREKIVRRKIEFPKVGGQFQTVESLVPYLLTISGHLVAGHVNVARNRAIELSKQR
jgi:hypothetical protein